jgi:hypothetical protein
VEEVVDSMDKITLQFTPKPEDYSIAIKTYISNRQTSFSVLRGILGVPIFTILLSLVLNIFNGDFQSFLCYLPILLMLLLVLFLPAISGSSVARKTLKQPQLPHPVTFELDDEKIYITTQLAENKLDWNVFNKVVETDLYYLFIYTVNKNMIQFLPKRSFVSQTQQEDVRLLVEKKLGKIENIQKGIRGWKLSLLVFIAFIAVIVLFGLMFLVTILWDAFL